jgi:hypothetical protein
MSSRASFFFVMMVGAFVAALTMGGAVSHAVAQVSATIVSIEGEATTYYSLDRDGKVIPVQVPAQSSADLKGKEAQGTLQATVTTMDAASQRATVQTRAGQTLVLELTPAALTSLRVGETFTFQLPASPR